MRKIILDWLWPTLVAAGSLLFIIGWLYLSVDGAAHPTSFLGGFAQSLEIVDKNLAFSVLRAVNFVTVLYGIVFYVLEDNENSTFMRTLTILALPAILTAAPYSTRFILARSFDIPDSDMAKVTSHYITSMLLILYFYGADRRKFVRSNNRRNASVFGFASMYVSAPSFWALMAFLMLHVVMIIFGLKPQGEGSLFFLAGASATILFLSNLLLSLSEAPYYAPYIRVIVSPRRSKARSHTMLGKLIITGVAAAVVGVLAYTAAITVTFIPGVAAIYPATAAEAAFGAWFGLWGAIASYIGLLIAGTMSGWFGVANGLLLATSDFLMALAPAMAVRYFRVDPALRTFRDMLGFVASTLVLGSFPGSLIYNYINLKLGVIAGMHTYWIAVAGWNVGNLLVLIFLGIPIMRLGTPALKKVDLLFARML